MSTPGGSRTLWLLRHAKAAPGAPSGGADHDRPLTARGREDAAALGRLLPSLGHPLPEVVLTSTARRTVETAERVAMSLDVVPDRRRRLYYGSPDDVLDELGTVDAAARSVMVVGHNPTTHQLALELLGADDASGRAALSSFPTCGLAVLVVRDGDWGGLAPRTASLAEVRRPPYASPAPR